MYKNREFYHFKKNCFIILRNFHSVFQDIEEFIPFKNVKEI